MNTTQQATTEQPAVGIIQTSYTVSVTFTDKPSDELRKKLKASGFLYDRGRWFKNQSDSNMGTGETVDQLLAA